MKPKKVQLKRAHLPEQIVAVLRTEIFTGEIKPGENLPSERELAGRFGTSRVTMRKALAALAQEGWIEIVHGRGNTVRDFTHSVGIEVLPQLLLACPEAVLRSGAGETMIEFVVWLYTEIDLAAARKARPQDQPLLLRLLALHRDDESPAELWENDFRFMDELLRIGGNPLLQLYFNSQRRFLQAAIDAGMISRHANPLPVQREVILARIEAICSGDPDRVRRAIAKTTAEMKHAFRSVFAVPPRRARRDRKD